MRNVELRGLRRNMRYAAKQILVHFLSNARLGDTGLGLDPPSTTKSSSRTEQWPGELIGPSPVLSVREGLQYHGQKLAVLPREENSRVAPGGSGKDMVCTEKSYYFLTNNDHPIASEGDESMMSLGSPVPPNARSHPTPVWPGSLDTILLGGNTTELAPG